MASLVLAQSLYRILKAAFFSEDYQQHVEYNNAFQKPKIDVCRLYLENLEDVVSCIFEVCDIIREVTVMSFNIYCQC